MVQTRIQSYERCMAGSMWKCFRFIPLWTTWAGKHNTPISLSFLMAALWNLFFLHYVIAQRQTFSSFTEKHLLCWNAVFIPLCTYVISSAVVYVEEFTWCWNSCLQNSLSLFCSGVLNFLARALRWISHLDISQFILSCKDSLFVSFED